MRGTGTIEQLLVSPVHRYEGRPGDGPAPAPPGELVDTAVVRAQHGLQGDRYFAHRAHRDAAVTFVAVEHVPAGADLTTLRRNVLLRGVEVDDLVGQTITVTCAGEAPIRFRVNRRANPCAWMDATIGPGAFRALRGRGGIRTTPLDDGVLRVGPVEVLTERSLPSATIVTPG